MKKMLLIASLIVIGLSGCIVPYDDHYDRGHHGGEDHGQSRDHHDHRDGGHGEND